MYVYEALPRKQPEKYILFFSGTLYSSASALVPGKKNIQQLADCQEEKAFHSVARFCKNVRFFHSHLRDRQ